MSASVVCLSDKGREDPPYPFDFPAYLAHLQRHNANLVRMWTREQVADLDLRQPGSYITPLPWARTGPGLALDGKPRFDLTRFDLEYFARMRQRAALAGRQGIYMSIMLFEGHGHRFAPKPWGWRQHPFNVHNNSNGIDGDPKNTGAGQSLHTLDLPKITALQETYVRHVIDTVNDLDNVLYEISNEDGEYSKDWQDHWIRFIHKYETGKPKQHPVGMTFAWMGSEEATNRVLFESKADWISPLGNDPKGPWKNDPPAGDGRKVVLVDTDHLWGVGGNVAWVWKTFCRGHNTIFYEKYAFNGDSSHTVDAGWDSLRKSLGYTRLYSQRMNMAEAMPHDDLASTKYCLSDGRSHFLIFLPDGPYPYLTVNLENAPGLFNVEWLNPHSGQIMPHGQIIGGVTRELICPFRGEAVLYLWIPSTGR